MILPRFAFLSVLSHIIIVEHVRKALEETFNNFSHFHPTLRSHSQIVEWDAALRTIKRWLYSVQLSVSNIYSVSFIMRVTTRLQSFVNHLVVTTEGSSFSQRVLCSSALRRRMNLSSSRACPGHFRLQHVPSRRRE